MFKALDIATKGFKEMFRNLKSTAIIFILPMVFMGVFALVFGQQNQEMTYTIGIVENTDSTYKAILEKIQAKETPKGKKIFEIKNFSDAGVAKNELVNQRLKAVLTWQAPETLRIQGDTTSMAFGSVLGTISPIVSDYYTSQIPAEFRIQQPDKLVVESITSSTDSNLSGFQYVAPGLIIYGILMLLPYVTEVLSGLVQKKEIFRYFTSKASVLDIFAGYLIFLMAVAMVQTLILYGVADFLGMDPQGSIWTVLLIAIPTCLFTIGLGMLVGTFAKKADEASGLATIINIILGFLSGSFLQFPEIKLVDNFLGRTWYFTDLVPTAQASSALRSVLLFGKGVSEVSFEIGFVFASSLLVFVVGVLTYSQIRFKKLEG